MIKAMNIKHFVLGSLILLLSFSSVSFISNPKVSALPDECQDSFLTIPAWYNYLPESEEGDCQPTLGDGNEEEQVNTSLAIGIAILEGLLRASTFVALVMIFWGSFKFITSQGNPDNATKARQTVINAAIGFAIVLIASQIVAYVGRTLGG